MILSNWSSVLSLDQCVCMCAHNVGSNKRNFGNTHTQMRASNGFPVKIHVAITNYGRTLWIKNHLLIGAVKMSYFFAQWYLSTENLFRCSCTDRLSKQTASKHDAAIFVCKFLAFYEVYVNFYLMKLLLIFTNLELSPDWRFKNWKIDHVNNDGYMFMRPIRSSPVRCSSWNSVSLLLCYWVTDTPTTMQCNV